MTNYGYDLTQSKLEQIVPMESSRADVAQQWGPPSTVSPFNPNIWYYIGETDSQRGIFAPKVEKRQLIKVVFNDEDLVASVSQMDPERGRDIDIVERRTPTAGKEFNALQQFVGNLGRYNSAGADKKQ